MWVERSAVVRAGVRTARAGHWLWAHLPVLPCMRWGCDVPVVWERICRRANKEPTEGPPDVLRRPFVGGRLWSSEQKGKLRSSGTASS